MANDAYAQNALTEAQVNIARLEATVTALAGSVIELKASQAQLAIQLSAIQTTLNEARGGWRVMMMVGGSAGTLGAALAWIVSHVPNLK